MRRSIITFAVAAAVAMGGLAQPASALSDKDKKKLGAALLGVAIASKIRENRREDRRSDMYVAGEYKGSPIRCFVSQRTCYWRGKYAPNSTHREFGYR